MMLLVKALVSLKRVVDYQVKIRICSDQTDVDTQNLKMSTNPFDEIALEEAVRLKEQGIVTEIIAVSVGVSACEEILRRALALGADRAILIHHETELEPLNVAKLLQIIVEREKPEIILMGKQAIDNDCNQTGQILAGLLNWSQATFASKVEIQEKYAIVTREIDGGLETIRADLPCVITADLRLNQPRYVTLPNLMKAKTKPLEILEAIHLVSDLNPHLKLLKVTSPPQRKAGVKIKNLRELFTQLTEQGITL